MRAHYRPRDGRRRSAAGASQKRADSPLAKDIFVLVSQRHKPRASFNVWPERCRRNAPDRIHSPTPWLPPLPSSYPLPPVSAPAPASASAHRASHSEPPSRHIDTTTVAVTRYSLRFSPLPLLLFVPARGAVWLSPPSRLCSLAPDLWSLLLCPPPPGTAPLHPSALVLGRPDALPLADVARCWPKTFMTAARRRD